MLHERVLRRATMAGERPALIDAPTGFVLTYDALADRIEQIAARLLATGIGPGSVVAIWARNIPHWACSALGAMRAGATVTGVAPLATEAELRAQLVDARAHVLVTESQRAEAAL